jgi:hypothetical protein
MYRRNKYEATSSGSLFQQGPGEVELDVRELEVQDEV